MLTLPLQICPGRKLHIGTAFRVDLIGKHRLDLDIKDALGSGDKRLPCAHYDEKHASHTI